MHLALENVDIARWQFGITTVYHYLFVPLTIGLAALTAVLETAWVRTGKEHYLKATKFWGKLFLINIAMGVVTGIVQEFQFGMNWSEYSRFVGDVFGAPLAFEALLAFFFESTFIGLWIFGWDRLPKKVHLACIWMVSLGTVLSASFILAANSWMQHPVGYRIDAETGRAEMTDIVAVLTQKTAVVVVAHTLTAAFLTAAAFMAGIACYHLARRRHVKVMRTSLRLALTVMVVFGIGTALSGDALGKVMYEQQPMKMAAAEALWETEKPAPFTLFAYGDVDEGHNKVAVEIPGVLSYLGKGDFSAEVPGINDINEAEQLKYGPGDYRPNIPVAYWGFRWMIGFGMTSFAFGVVGLWLTRRRFWLAPEHRTASDEPPKLMLTRGRSLAVRPSRWFWRIGLITMVFPLIANSWGWIFTETGRQPWAVYGLLKTSAAVSPGVSTAEVLTSLAVFTALYGVLAVIEVRLLLTYAKAGPAELTPNELRDPGDDDPGADADADRPLAFAY
ncbi:cytochrome BD ubiquinol oxidase subunit I [Wenjunlia vitaminophila]|uniref:Cytochrome BD ubiquinol oxidase subunit I n=1 Tax=Wenjunlia vitaminophila TaxID=76728 RepID=A0A0T6LM72_WENVI|nr:cytochrome ubiquinol oxidase subunit I [Wenjunlia vitaminophila]KRV47235.1 cytochrome BD ubiquinol oxidase subunit I [Wenjunlia vitaminophila]